jgi:hypothetical protein
MSIDIIVMTVDTLDPPAAPEYDLDFFFDPVCPWAWLTSRWVVEVAGQRGLKVNWRFISLRLINSHRDYATEFPDGYSEVHGSGLKFLRVAAALRAAGRGDDIAAYYTQVGGDIHVRGRRDEMIGQYDTGFGDYLASVGMAPELAAAANDESFDAVVQADTDEALSRTGKNVGTPILSFYRDGGVYSFFGPVISRVPRGEEALRLWDATWELSTFSGLAELKRSLREHPQLADSLG